MSLILDALRKSDHQRTRNAVERLRDGPPVASAPGFPATAALLLLAVVASAALAIVSVLLLTTDRANDTRIESAADNRVVNAAPVRALGMEVVSRRSEAPPPEAPAPVTTSAVQAPIVDGLAPTVDELAAPPLASLPAETRRRLPELHVNVHAWAEDPRARFVLINLKRYQEGDRLVEGPLVRHILRDGVVLEFEGTLFSLSRR